MLINITFPTNLGDSTWTATIIFSDSDFSDSSEYYNKYYKLRVSKKN